MIAKPVQSADHLCERRLDPTVLFLFCNCLVPIVFTVHSIFIAWFDAALLCEGHRELPHL